MRSITFVRPVPKAPNPQADQNLTDIQVRAPRSLASADANPSPSQPVGRSLIAAGVWQPGSSELSTIRHAILQDPAPLRKAISAPAFVELFGEPKAQKGVRKNVFGQDDECVLLRLSSQRLS